MFEIGYILENKYKITDHIGTGGGGIVYKAIQIGLNRTVAIKQIKENVVGVLKDRSEADILKNLKNNYIPSVFDFIENDGEIYTVMEFIDGQSFQQLIDSGRKFSQKKVLKYARQLCKAVAYLHSRKPPIIHSDIKPANIMLTPEDNICLIDYNISLIVDGNENAIGVSDGYSPPEQYGKPINFSKTEVSGIKYSADTSDKSTLFTEISNDKTLIDSTMIMNVDDGKTLIDNSAGDVYTKTMIQKADTVYNGGSETEIDCGTASEKTPVGTDRKVDKRSDIYSIGATIYGIAVGERPAVSTGNVKLFKDKNSSLSESFAAIIDKAMEKNPAKRFGSAEQMLKALNNIRRYDKRYKNLVMRQEIAAITVIAAMGAACLTSVMGYIRIGEETYDRYDTLVLKMDNADISAAEKCCSEAAEIFPERAEAYEKLAEIIYQTENYALTAEYIEKIIDGKPLFIGNENVPYSYGKLYYMLGRCYIELENFDSAAEILEKAIYSDGSEVSYYCDYAAALARCGNPEKAEETLKTAVEKGLSNADILFVRGEIEYSLKNYTESIKNIKGCIEASPDSDIIYRAYLLGANAYLFAYKGNNEIGGERIEFLISAINTLPVEKTVPFHEMLAQAYIDEAENSQNDLYFTEALKVYEKMDSQGWSTASANYNIIKLYRKIGNFKYAKEYAEKILEKNGDDYVIYKLLAFIESDLQNQKNNSDRDYSDFCAYYEKAAALCNNDEDGEMQILAEAYKEAKERK